MRAVEVIELGKAGACGVALPDGPIGVGAASSAGTVEVALPIGHRRAFRIAAIRSGEVVKDVEVYAFGVGAEEAAIVVNGSRSQGAVEVVVWVDALRRRAVAVGA